MAKKQRIKGRRGEQEVVKYWRDLFPKARRNLEFQTELAEGGIDVILDSWHKIQVKIGSHVPKKCYQFLEQMKEERGELHFVQAHRDNKDWIIIIKASDFKELIAMLKANNIIK